MGQTATSKSAAVNEAAKDDLTCVSHDGSFALSALMANDPGSAKFVSFTPVQGLTFDPIHGTFTIDGTFDLSKGFDYTEQMGNGHGTFSTAHVSFDTNAVWHGDTILGADLVQNSSFEADPVSGQYSSFGSLTDWHTVAGGASLEVVTAGYYGINGDGHWLDTKGSPGGIDISQQINVGAGQAAQLSINVASEDLAALGRSTDPNAHLEVLFDNHVVLDVTVASLAAQGPANNFQTLTANVTGQAGGDTIEIKDVGTTTGENYVGFALDSVSVHTTTTDLHHGYFTC